MLINQLKVGKKIGIFVNRSIGVLEHAYELKSQIADAISQNEYLILTPLFRGKPVSLVMSDKLLITFAYGDDGLLVFEAEVRELIVDINGISMYRIVGLTEAGKLQRREHYRMNIQIPIVYQAKKNGKHIYGQGLTSDISGGGVRFICSDGFEVGDFLNVFIIIEPDIDLRTQVEIVRIQAEGDKKYEISSIFSLEFREREKLIKHVFDIQRETIKKQKHLNES